MYVLPASYGQERLWLLDQTQPGTPVHNVSGVLRLRGPVEAGRLERCLAEIVERHEVLRTTLRLSGDGVAQVIRAGSDIRLRRAEVAEADAPALAAELEREPFDLGTGPLLRCHLLTLAPDHHLLVVVVHHAVSDGWSMGILLQELSARYAGTTDLPELPVQYADYAVWQRELVDSDGLDEQLAYWRERLAGAPPLRLPADLAVPAAPTYSAHVVPVAVPAGDVRAARGQATSFMVALAAFTVVLARWSGQSDVVVALPVAGRPQVELEPLIGFFVNTLPLRVELEPDTDFAAVLEQVRVRCLEAYAHADVPFELLVERLRPARRAGQVPLAQAMLALNNTPMPPLTALPGLTMELVELPTTHVQFDVLVDLVETPAGLRGTVALHADTFSAGTAELVGRSLSAVLAAAGAAPATRVADLPCPIGADRAWPGPVVAEEEDERPERAASAGEPPSTPAEHLLAGLWAEVLELDSVGVTDDFYAQGGNSMRAVRVVTRARELGLELPIEVVLGEHTIRDLASAPAGSPDRDPAGQSA